MRGKSPEVKEKRLKIFIYGPAWSGKTTGAIQFPKSYIIDAEKGTEEYSRTIIDKGSHVFASNDPDEIREEIHSLLTTKHEFRTLIIDPVTQVYNGTQDKWNRIFEKYATTDKEKEIQDFGMRYWGKVKSEYKRLQRLLMKLDMNIICTAHQKDVYGTGFSKIGTTFDSMKGEDYFYDIIFQLERQGDKLFAKTIKERAEIGYRKFPDEFEWSYDNFCKYYGKEILEKEAIPVAMASPEQIEKIDRLVKVVNLDAEIINRWLTKTDCDSFADMTADQIQKCVDYVEKQLETVKGGK